MCSNCAFAFDPTTTTTKNIAPFILSFLIPFCFASRSFPFAYATKHTHTHGQCVQYIHNNKKAGRTLICFDVIRFAIQSLHRHIFELKCEWTMFQATYNIAMFFFFEFIATISLCFPLFIAQTLAVSLFHCRIFTIHSWCKVVWMWVNAFRFMVGAILTI